MTAPPRGPLSIPAFRDFWAATVLSNVGGTIQSVAAAWLMTTLAGSSVMVALVQSSATLPVMLLALWSGAVADAYDRRRVMLVSQVFMLIVSATLAALSWVGAVSPVGLLAMTFLIGGGTAVNWPAMQVAVAEIVPPVVLPRAVALNGLGVNLARSVGPAVGGGVLAAFGAPAAFLLNAVSFVPLVAVLARWRYRPPERTLPRERIGAAILAGVRYGMLSPALRAIAIRSLAFGMVASAVPALMPIVARDLVAGGPLTFGALLAAFGVGAVGGAFASARLRARWSAEAIVRRLGALFAFGALLAGLSRSLPLTLLAMATTGAGWLVVLTTFNVATQLSSPRWVVARALSIYQMTTYGGMAVGSWAFGALAGRVGCASALCVAAAGAVAVAAVGRLLPIRGERLDMAPRGGWTVPDVAVPIEMRSGPIVVSVEHRVRVEDAERFVALMGERSRILRRDGARDWSLQQDLEEPELWIEAYRLPTWLDYVLLNRRRTMADHENHEALAAVRIPGTVLVVRRRIQRHAGPSRASTAYALGPSTVPAAIGP